MAAIGKCRDRVVLIYYDHGGAGVVEDVQLLEQTFGMNRGALDHILS